MFLLDTNVLSELRKARSGQADRHVVAWAERQAPEVFFISAITVMELEMGVLRILRRDAAAGARLRDWMDRQVMPAFAQRVLAIDAAVARRCAALPVPDPRSERDALIAATALEHGLIVATRNTPDFAATQVPLVNPWDGA